MVISLTLLAGGGGCSRLCSGPGCEDDYGASRLSLVRSRSSGGELDAWADADAIVDGTWDEGWRWDVSASDDGIAVGMPDLGVVRIWVWRDDGLMARDLSWSGGEHELGAAVLLGDVEDDGRPDLWVGIPGDRLDRGSARLVRNALRRGSLDVDDADVILTGPSPGARLGETIVRCGDLDGDHRPEWLVGIPGLSSSAAVSPSIPSLAGGVLLVRSTALGQVGSTPTLDELGPVLWGTTSGEGAGRAVTCGDFTGDGLDDIVVGAPWAGEDDRGAVYVVDGTATAGLTASPLGDVAARVLEGPWEGGWFGASLASGRVDADLHADLLVGAPGRDAGTGSAALYLGQELSTSRWQPALAFTADRDRSPGDHVGATVLLEDINGDGRDDVVVGAPAWDQGERFRAGRVSVWSGRDTWPAIARMGDDEDLALTGPATYAELGRRVVVRDVDRDGRGDLLLLSRWNRR